MSWVDRTRLGRRHGRNRTGSAAPTPSTPSGDASAAPVALSRPVPEIPTDDYPDPRFGADGVRVDGRSPGGRGAVKPSDHGSLGNGTNGAGRMQVSAPGVSANSANGRRQHATPGSGPSEQATLPLTGGPRFGSVTLHEADIVAVLSATGRFVFVSASAERLLGFDVSHAVGRDALALFDADSAPGVRGLFDDLVARRRLFVALELRTARADGRPLDLEVVAANHLQDPVGGIVVAVRDVTARKRAEARSKDADRRQHALIESLADGLVMVDVDGTVVRVNEAYEVLFHSPRTRVLGHALEDLVWAAQERGLEIFDEQGATMAAADHPVLVSLMRGRRVDGAVVGYRRGDAPVRWIRINAQPIHGPGGEVAGAVGTCSDITDTRRAAYALRQEEEFLRVLLDTLDEGIVACDAQGRMTIFNPAARRLHGLDDSVEPIGRVPSSSRLRHPDGSPIAPGENPLLLAMAGERLENVEIVLVPSEGEQRKVSVNGQPLVDEDGWKLGAVVAMHDVTEQKRNEERLADLAHHDPLTGLANRTLLATRMAEAIDALDAPPDPAARRRGPDGARAHPEHPGVAVYLLDLDNFKEVNDEFGHEVGDDLLVAVARRLAALVRPSDTVARLGGDEFVVVCGIESGEEEMLRISQRITAALARPYRIDGRTLVAEASVGGVFADDPDTDPSKLLSLADDAMYAVKWSRRRQRRPMTD